MTGFPLEDCAELIAAARRPHPPLENLDDFAEIRAALRALPLFPSLQLAPRLLRRKLRVRGIKDALLKDLLVARCWGRPGWIYNPCCVFARHARDLASRLPMASVVATDIDPRWNWLFESLQLTGRRQPRNFSFQVGNVYGPSPIAHPQAVCFFGACGSLTDAALRSAVATGADFIAGRACCHENIGMNTETSPHKPTLWDLGHRVKNIVYRHCAARHGHYFHPDAAIEAYPQSAKFREWMDPAAMLRCARHAVNCHLCRTIIDLDRAMYLVENNYYLLGYHENMLIAARAD